MILGPCRLVILFLPRYDDTIVTIRAGIYVFMQIFEQHIYIYNLRTMRNSLGEIRRADTVWIFRFSTDA